MKNRTGMLPISPPQRGFTLVELMIAVTLSLIAIGFLSLILGSVAQSRNITVTGGDAIANGSTVTFMIERDLKQAGNGLNFTPLLGCNLRAYDSLRSSNKSFTVPLMPVSITAGANSKTSDSLRIQYGASDNGHTLINFDTNPVVTAGCDSTGFTSGNDRFCIDNPYGFRAGDLVIMANPSTSDDCSLYQATTDWDPNQRVVYIASSGRYNKSGGLGVDYPTGSVIVNEGPALSSPSASSGQWQTLVDKTYSVSSNTLNVFESFNPYDLANPTSTTPLSDGVFLLKAYYLKDTNLDGTIDAQDQTAPTAATWPQVRAVRVALVTRTSATDAQNLSNSTLEILPSQNIGTFAAPSVSITLTADERKYKYKVFQTVVPLRNQLWGGS